MRAESATQSARRALFKFDLASVSGEIHSAKLRVYVGDGTSTGPGLHIIENTWTEGGVTWLNQPALDGPKADVKSVVPARGYIEYDVSRVVAGPGTFSFALVGEGTDELIARSREDATLRPSLVVTTVGDGEYALSYKPLADAYVDEGSPGSNFGRATTLPSRLGPPQQQVFMKFEVADVEGRASRAYLRVYVSDASANAPTVYVTSSTWDEGTITWNNRPSLVSSVGGATTVAGGSFYEYDVTSAVGGNGTYSFALIPDSTDTLGVTSREGAAAEVARLNVIAIPSLTSFAQCGDRYCCMEPGEGSCSTSYLHNPSNSLSSDGRCKRSTTFRYDFGTDWRARSSSGYTPDPDVFCVAPHGMIEEHTQTIARNCAKLTPQLGWWTFDGYPREQCRTITLPETRAGTEWIVGAHFALHVTSARYNYEPLTSLLPNYQTVIAIHGQKSTPAVCVGGKSTRMAAKFKQVWNGQFDMQPYKAWLHDELGSPCQQYSGTNDSNPANLGHSGVGLQIELPADNANHQIRTWIADVNSLHGQTFQQALSDVVLEVKTFGPY